MLVLDGIGACYIEDIDDISYIISLDQPVLWILRIHCICRIELG